MLYNVTVADSTIKFGVIGEYLTDAFSHVRVDINGEENWAQYTTLRDATVDSFVF